MNSKITIFTGGFVLMLGAILLLGAGCAKEETVTPPPSGGEIPTGYLPPVTDEDQNPADLYASAKEISSPTALAGELKSIFNEVCGGVKLKQEFMPTAMTGHMLVYVWKNEPTAEKLESAFESHGYSIELGGEALIVKKGTTLLAVSWVEEEESQEIGVLITTEE